MTKVEAEIAVLERRIVRLKEEQKELEHQETLDFVNAMAEWDKTALINYLFGMLADKYSAKSLVEEFRLDQTELEEDEEEEDEQEGRSSPS